MGTASKLGYNLTTENMFNGKKERPGITWQQEEPPTVDQRVWTEYLVQSLYLAPSDPSYQKQMVHNDKDRTYTMEELIKTICYALRSNTIISTAEVI